MNICTDIHPSMTYTASAVRDTDIGWGTGYTLDRLPVRRRPNIQRQTNIHAHVHFYNLESLAINLQFSGLWQEDTGRTCKLHRKLDPSCSKETVLTTLPPCRPSCMQYYTCFMTTVATKCCPYKLFCLNRTYNVTTTATFYRIME